MRITSLTKLVILTKLTIKKNVILFPGVHYVLKMDVKHNRMQKFIQLNNLEILREKIT